MTAAMAKAMKRAEGGFRTIIVAYDGSENSVRAVSVAASMASKFGSTLIVAHVYTSPLVPYSVAGAPMPNYDELEKAAENGAREVLAAGVRAAKAMGVDARGELLEASSTVQALSELTANEKADLLIVGTRGMTGFKKLILGSVSSGLVGHASCSVLVVR
jgi:nucleotide-binding universal stress UspA family protein